MADGCHFLDHNIKCAWMLYHVLRVMNVLVLKRIYSFIKTAVWSRLWCKTARYSARWAGVSFQRGTPEGASIQVSLCHQTLSHTKTEPMTTATCERAAHLLYVLEKGLSECWVSGKHFFCHSWFTHSVLSVPDCIANTSCHVTPSHSPVWTLATLRSCTSAGSGLPAVFFLAFRGDHKNTRTWYSMSSHENLPVPSHKDSTMYFYF